MSLNNPYPGEGYVPAYQVAAIPFVTSSTLSLGQIKEIRFDQVSKFLTIKNTGATSTAMCVSFTQNGLKPSNSNYFVLSGSEVFSGDLRTTKLFVSGSVGSPTFTVIAGLTSIPSKNAVILTGSNGFSGVG